MRYVRAMQWCLRRRRAACVEHQPRRRLGAGETAVVVVILVLAVVLTLAGEPLLTVIELFIGAGLLTAPGAGGTGPALRRA